MRSPTAVVRRRRSPRPHKSEKIKHREGARRETNRPSSITSLRIVKTKVGLTGSEQRSRDGGARVGSRHVVVLHVAVHVGVLPEQPVAAEGVQLDRAVRRVHRGRGGRPARGVHHPLVEVVHPVHRSGRVGDIGR